MKALLWRAFYALICWFIFWWIFPLFLSVIGMAMPGNLLLLLRAITAGIAVLYVLFGPEPPTPF